MKTFNQINEQANRLIDEAEKHYNFKRITLINTIKQAYKDNIKKIVNRDLNIDQEARIIPMRPNEYRIADYYKNDIERLQNELKANNELLTLQKILKKHGKTRRDTENRIINIETTLCYLTDRARYVNHKNALQRFVESGCYGKI